MSTNINQSTNLDCFFCDGTGRQTRKDETGIWRYPVSCGGCHGTGTSERAVLEAIGFLVDSGRMTSTAGYNTLLDAARRIMQLKRW